MIEKRNVPPAHEETVQNTWSQQIPEWCYTWWFHPMWGLEGWRSIVCEWSATSAHISFQPRTTLWPVLRLSDCVQLRLWKSAYQDWALRLQPYSWMLSTWGCPFPMPEQWWFCESSVTEIKCVGVLFEKEVCCACCRVRPWSHQHRCSVFGSEEQLLAWGLHMRGLCGAQVDVHEGYRRCHSDNGAWENDKRGISWCQRCFKSFSHCNLVVKDMESVPWVLLLHADFTYHADRLIPCGVIIYTVTSTSPWHGLSALELLIRSQLRLRVYSVIRVA